MILTRHTFEIIDHTADLGIVVAGSNLKELFQNASHAMMRIMLEEVPEESGETTKISVQGSDLPDLMVRWLGEILYLFEGENRLVTQSKILEITPNHLDARIKTTPFSSAKHEILTEIKAVTYHQIEVIRKGGVWNARIIFDL
jgi:SHS2 domain-containing protein